MSINPFTVFYKTESSDKYISDLFSSIDDLKKDKNSIGFIEIALDSNKILFNIKATFNNGSILLWSISSFSYESSSNIVSVYPNILFSFNNTIVQQIPQSIIIIEENDEEEEEEIQIVEAFIGLNKI